jgi:hypothetical protein
MIITNSHLLKHYLLVVFFLYLVVVAIVTLHTDKYQVVKIFNNRMLVVFIALVSKFTKYWNNS